MEAAVAEIRREAATQQQRLQAMLQQLFTHAAAHAAAPANATAHAPAHAAAHAAPYAPSVPAPPLAEPPPHWLPLRRASAPGRPAAVTAAGGAAAYAPAADPGGRPQSAGLALQPRPGSAACSLHARPGSAGVPSWLPAAPPPPPLPPPMPPPPPSDGAPGTQASTGGVGHATVPPEELQKLLDDFLKHGIAPRDGIALDPRRAEASSRPA